jgi:hypothetical protein
VARTLAELTLKLSQDLSRLEEEGAKQMNELGEARDVALMEIRSAEKALKSYNRGLEKAKATQLKSVQAANKIRDKEIRTAEDKRRLLLTLEERRHREAKNRAFRKRQETLRKAKAVWKKAIERIRTRPLFEQRALRKSADIAYEEAIEKAEDKYRDAIDDARLELQSALQNTLADERIALERAHRTAERMITTAVVSYERAVAGEEGRLRSELAGIPEAREVQENYDRQFLEIRKSTEKRREELFRKFTQDRKKLKR